MYNRVLNQPKRSKLKSSSSAGGAGSGSFFFASSFFLGSSFFSTFFYSFLAGAPAGAPTETFESPLLMTSSTFLLLSDLMTASTWASSTGLPVALRMAITESLAEWESCYLGLFQRDWRGRLLRRTASLMVNIKYYNSQLLIIYCWREIAPSHHYLW